MNIIFFIKFYLSKEGIEENAIKKSIKASVIEQESMFDLITMTKSYWEPSRERRGGPRWNFKLSHMVF